jgi:hypothetical protein
MANDPNTAAPTTLLPKVIFWICVDWQVGHLGFNRALSLKRLKLQFGHTFNIAPCTFLHLTHTIFSPLTALFFLGTGNPQFTQIFA